LFDHTNLIYYLIQLYAETASKAKYSQY